MEDVLGAGFGWGRGAGGVQASSVARGLLMLPRGEDGAKLPSAGTASPGACVPHTRAPAYFLQDHSRAAKHFLLPGYLLLNI